MKLIENFLKTTCAYTVAILAAFYIFAITCEFPETSISFGRFSLLLLFGAAITLAGYLFRLKINKLVIILLHFSVLLFAFTIIFISSGILSGGSNIFMSVILFAVLYFAVFAVVYFIKRGIGAADKKLDKRLSKKNASNYTPRFKDINN